MMPVILIEHTLSRSMIMYLLAPYNEAKEEQFRSDVLEKIPNMEERDISLR